MPRRNFLINRKECKIISRADTQEVMKYKHPDWLPNKIPQPEKAGFYPPIEKGEKGRSSSASSF